MCKVALLTSQLDCFMSLDIAHICAFATGFLEADNQLLEKGLDTAAIADEVMKAFWDSSRGIGERDRWKAECDAIKEQIGELKAMYGAMRKFCDEAGLEMGDILCWSSTIKETIMLARGYLEMPIKADETFLDALHRGFRSLWRGKLEKYLEPYIEEEIERYWKEVKQDIQGYDSIDIYTSNDQIDVP